MYNIKTQNTNYFILFLTWLWGVVYVVQTRSDLVSCFLGENFWWFKGCCKLNVSNVDSTGKIDWFSDKVEGVVLYCSLLFPKKEINMLIAT